MNVFFVIDGRLVTPSLSDSILDGVTRDSPHARPSALESPAAERPVSVEELQHGLEHGQVSEAFGAGTAAVVSPIGSIGIDGQNYTLPVVGAGPSAGCPASIALFLKNELDAIRYGLKTDIHGWNSFTAREPAI